MVSSGGFRLLLSADAESEALLPLGASRRGRHEGARTTAAPTRAFPRCSPGCGPELAAIEVGENTYGHPAPSTLAALRRARVPTYRTDRDGTVTLTVDASGVRVDTEH